jgi:hypothetical protein
MIRNEKILNRMRRRSAFLALIIFFMAIWIKNLYDDIDWIRSESNSNFIENMNKDKQIHQLTQKIDSLKKLNVKVEKQIKPKKRFNHKPDSVSVIPIDIIKSDTIK